MMEDYDNALVYYRKASDYSPRDPFPLLNSGYCLMELGKEEDAIRFYKAALAVDPGNERAKAELARFE
ncbi:MAG: tetratricopeptide repeat protein, partial [Promethearchaeota archaeon]